MKAQFGRWLAEGHLASQPKSKDVKIIQHYHSCLPPIPHWNWNHCNSHCQVQAVTIWQWSFKSAWDGAQFFTSSALGDKDTAPSNISYLALDSLRFIFPNLLPVTCRALWYNLISALVLWRAVICPLNYSLRGVNVLRKGGVRTYKCHSSRGIPDGVASLDCSFPQCLISCSAVAAITPPLSTEYFTWTNKAI